ncbi:MAG: hypothetical protein ACI9I4_002003, partial [Neolewinella sp.]
MCLGLGRIVLIWFLRDWVLYTHNGQSTSVTFPYFYYTRHQLNGVIAEGNIQAKLTIHN